MPSLEYDDFDFDFEPSDEPFIVNNANGISYQCDDCDVRGIVRHKAVLSCWCCGKNDKLRTRVDLRIHGASYRYATGDHDLSQGSQRSDDN